MATIVFDGTASVTASASADQIVFSALPTSVSNVAEVNGNVVIAVGANTLTITGATLASLVAANFITSNVWTGNGLVTTPPDATGNDIIGKITGNTSLVFGLGGGGAGVHDSISVGTTVATGNHLIFGGAGFGDTTDGTDIINAGAPDKSAGTYAVYANGGADTVNVLVGASTAGTASVYGGGGDDQISVGSATATVGGQIYGSAGADKLGVSTLGSVSIFGGTGISDTVDGGDVIGTAGKGTFFVYGNAGADSITHTSTAAGATMSIYGGNGVDSVTVTGAFSTTGQIFGGGDGDSIAVAGAAGGSTTIYGGTGISDSTDVADKITATGAGTFTIYGNGGNDTVDASGLTDGAMFSVYGGAGNDEITAGGATSTTGVVFGSQGTDTVVVQGLTTGSITVYGGTGVSDATDGADKLSVVSGTGKFTVYGNAGDDSISLGTGGDLNTATVYGGAGKDIITVSKTDQAAMDTAGAGAITLNGNEQVDTFVFAANAIGSTSDANTKGVAYAIGDFTAGGSGDVMNLAGLGAASAAFTVAATPASVQDGIDAATAGAAGVVTAFQFGSDTYVVVDGDAGTFDATKDTVIKLTGVTATSLAGGNFV